MIPASGAVASGAVGGLPLAIGVTVSGSASGRALAIASSTGAKISHATGTASLIATGAATGTKISLTQADLDAIAAAVWADPVAVAAHAKLDEIITRLTC